MSEQTAIQSLNETLERVDEFLARLRKEAEAKQELQFWRDERAAKVEVPEMAVTGQ